VTGTPIQREINDLFGLFCFLRHPALSYGSAWRRIVASFDHGDVDPFVRALGPLFWRHSKHHVADELQLPAQHVLELPLTMSAVEQLNYSRQVRTCTALLQRYERTASPDLLLAMMREVVLLRQICCHPSLARPPQRAGAAGAAGDDCRDIMTIAQVLDSMATEQAQGIGSGDRFCF
jgi:hypothetical protein